MPKPAKIDASDDPAMVKVRELWERKQADGLTMQKLGEAMGYPDKHARQAVSQFLKSHDPQVSMLRRFAKAVGVAVSTLVRE